MAHRSNLFRCDTQIMVRDSRLLANALSRAIPTSLFQHIRCFTLIPVHTKLSKRMQYLNRQINNLKRSPPGADPRSSWRMPDALQKPRIHLSQNLQGQILLRRDICTSPWKLTRNMIMPEFPLTPLWNQCIMPRYWKIVRELIS